MAQQSAFGLTSLYDPSIAVDQSALERQMALAQALRQQSMSPVETAGRQIGGVGYKVSPLEGLAKALQAYQANQADATNDKSRLSLMQKTAAAMGPMMAGMFGHGAAAAPVDPGRPPGVTAEAMTSGGFPQPPTAPAPAGETQGAKIKRAAMAAMLSGNTDLANKLIGNLLEMTPEQKNMIAKGQDPVRIGAAETALKEKEARAPTRLGNGFYGDVQGNIQGLPAQIPGAINIADPSAPGGWKTAPVPGGPEALEAQSRSEAFGKAAAIPFAGVDASGNPLPVRSVASALGGGAPAPAAPRGAPGVAKLEVVEPGKAGGVFSAPPLGSEHSQKGLDTSFESLKAANREAQNTKSYLQNIVTAAQKGAIIGPGAERREMIQGIFQLAGIKEDVNTNATTQTQLLDKYSNQIVARLGQNGLGTDAARAILASAYPGKHMNKDAIEEAVANLNGAQDMTMAKMRYLQEPGIKRDTATYQRREVEFDQAADPRIWQYANIQDPEKKKAFAQELLKQDPTLIQRVQKLKALGIL